MKKEIMKLLKIDVKPVILDVIAEHLPSKIYLPNCLLISEELLIFS